MDIHEIVYEYVYEALLEFTKDDESNIEQKELELMAKYISNNMLNEHIWLEYKYFRNNPEELAAALAENE